jgi:hypothetical protein
MFAGAYWSERFETKEQAARRFATFVSALTKISDELAVWYVKGNKKRAISLDPTAIAKLLDVEGGDHGYRGEIWNGKLVQVVALLGANRAYVNSAVVSEIGSKAMLNDDAWRQILHALIEAFDPDEAVVVNDEKTAQSEDLLDVGWLTYERGGQVSKQPHKR